MRVTVRMCDVCRAEVDSYWPLHINGHHPIEVDADFCSVACLVQWAGNLEGER